MIFDTRMPDGFNEGKVKAQLAGEKLYARPKLDRLPAGAPRALTRTEALAALQDAHQSVGGGLYEKVTRAILADVDKPAASPEPPPQKKKRVEVDGVTDALWHNVKKAEESKKQKSNALHGELSRKRQQKLAEARKQQTLQEQRELAQKAFAKAERTAKQRKAIAKGRTPVKPRKDIAKGKKLVKFKKAGAKTQQAREKQ